MEAEAKGGRFIGMIPPEKVFIKAEEPKPEVVKPKSPKTKAAK
jgi:hypothetical protein